MYRISVITDGKEYPLHEPYSEDIRAISPVLTMSMDTVGSLSFQLAGKHPHVSKLVPLKAEFYVHDDEEVIFCGRMVKPVRDFYDTVSVSCEGELAYLIDSQQRPYEFSGTVQEFLAELLRAHNGQVEERKQFLPGQVNVTVETGTIFSGDDYQTTLNVLKGVMELAGGHPRIRHEGGKRYLDLVSDFGGINSQVIRFGENLLDMSQYKDATKIFTCLIPTGGDIDYTDDTGATQTKRLDITSVNGGLDYITHEAGLAQYGSIWGNKRWDDVTDPEVLLAKARAYLDECVAMPETLEIKAVDLSLIDVDVQKLKLGYWTTVESIPHNLEKRFLLMKKEMHLDDPGSDRVLLGQTLSSFTSNTVKQQNQTSARIEKVAASASKEINRKVENATQLITGGTGGYVVLDIEDPNTGKKSHPWRILIMNTPDKETATNVIQLNQNGIGFSTTGIDGPYRNAWTIDGNLVADFITAGTMLADRIRGGTLELGGSGLAKDGQIVVKDASGTVIGSWDKTGLSVLRGILQGVSAVFGGVNNQNGAIEVRNGSGRMIGRWDKDGLYISNGVIDVGPFYADQDGVQLGDYYVSADGSNVFQSSDGSVVIQTASGGPFGSFSSFTLTSKSGTTTLSDHDLTINLIMARDINLDELEAEYGAEWNSISKNIIGLWNEIANIKNSL